MGESVRLERRSAPRHALSLPVRFPGGTGVTRDVSSTGLYFHTMEPLEVGQPVQLTVTLSRVDPGGVRDLTCLGTVRRVEVSGTDGGGTPVIGVAVAAEGFGFGVG